MAALDPRIETIRARYELSASDFWELPQKKGTWLVKHAALETAAARAGIIFHQPIIIEANSEAGVAVMSVSGEARDGRREWATGEASPKNNKNSYPWAMAEKRAKDRVILKLIGMHGLVYSEDEMDQSVPTVAAPVVERLSSSRAKEVLNWANMEEKVRSAATLKVLENWHAVIQQIEPLMPVQWHELLQTMIADRRKELSAGTSAAVAAFEQSATDRMETAP